MSLRVALQAIGLLVVGYVLLIGFLGMGPLGWIVIGTMLLIGIIQVHRTRSQPGTEGSDHPQFCVNCGATLDLAADDADDGERQEFEVNYCGSCGAPVPSTTETAAESERTNCSECGAPNDADQTKCDYCGAPL